MITNRQDLQLVRKWYGTRTNTTGVPLYTHSKSVARTLVRYIHKFDEVNPNDVRSLYQAALGHDLLEDTETSVNEIIDIWGKRVYGFILSLTNKQGDEDFNSYIKSLGKANEYIRLIKCADILSNVNNSIRQFENIDPNWLRDFWVPLLERYEKELLLIPWKENVLTGNALSLDIVQKIRILKKKANK